MKGFEEIISSLEENIIPSTEEGDVNEDEILEILLNTREQGQMMEHLIKNQIEVKDAMIDKLHKELDHYKRGEADRFTDQLMKAVIKVRKDMQRLVASERWGKLSEGDLRREYQYVFDDLTDLLEQQNVDSYSSSPGDVFDASIHQPKIEVTEVEALDKTVKSSISEGYKKGDKTLIPERVVIYQYRA